MALVPAFCSWMRVQTNACANRMVACLEFFWFPPWGPNGVVTT